MKSFCCACKYMVGPKDGAPYYGCTNKEIISELGSKPTHFVFGFMPCIEVNKDGECCGWEQRRGDKETAMEEVKK